MLLEVDLCERGRALRARLSEPVVHPVDLCVGHASFPQLEAALELRVDGLREALDLVRRELGRERVGRQPGVVEDLVRPGPADAGQGPLVT